MALPYMAKDDLLLALFLDLNLNEKFSYYLTTCVRHFDMPRETLRRRGIYIICQYFECQLEIILNLLFLKFHYYL